MHDDVEKLEHVLVYITFVSLRKKKSDTCNLKRERFILAYSFIGSIQGHLVPSQKWHCERACSLHGGQETERERRSQQ